MSSVFGIEDARLGRRELRRADRDDVAVFREGQRPAQRRRVGARRRLQVASERPGRLIGVGHPRVVVDVARGVRGHERVARRDRGRKRLRLRGGAGGGRQRRGRPGLDRLGGRDRRGRAERADGEHRRPADDVRGCHGTPERRDSDVAHGPVRRPPAHVCAHDSATVCAPTLRVGSRRLLPRPPWPRSPHPRLGSTPERVRARRVRCWSRPPERRPRRSRSPSSTAARSSSSRGSARGRGARSCSPPWPWVPTPGGGVPGSGFGPLFAATGLLVALTSLNALAAPLAFTLGRVVVRGDDVRHRRRLPQFPARAPRVRAGPAVRLCVRAPRHAPVAARPGVGGGVAPERAVRGLRRRVP